MNYNLDITAIQASIVAEVERLFPDIPVIPDGMVDSEDAPKDEYGNVAPFFVLWFHDIRRGPRRAGRSFGGTRMDSYRSRFDLISVAGDGVTCRQNLNDANNELIGWKPHNSGELLKGEAMWSDTRPVLDSSNVPTRFAATSRFDFGVLANRVEP